MDKISSQKGDQVAIVSLAEAKAHLSALVERATAGEQYWCDR
jgi:antitoxin (DNA-binding transcriptional repressor) of toxin-antitoxin stability system